MKKLFMIWLLPLSMLCLAVSCDSCIMEPTVSTVAKSAVTPTTAISGGEVTSDGGATVTARGVCWSTTTSPTIALSTKTTDGTGTGIFSSSITGLNPGVTYYVKAYATNSKGTGYGSEDVFTTAISTNTDPDGNTYTTVIIGTQTWMKENLKTTKYYDGTAIPPVPDKSAWVNLITPGYCWYNNDAATFKGTYGALYNWFTVNTGKLCPTGWHVPSDTEWYTLVLFLDASANFNNFYESYTAGGKLKETGTTHWLSPNSDATNTSGFTAVPGGSRSSDGTFDNIGYGGFWWTSIENTTVGARYQALNCNNSNVYKQGLDKKQGFSVRCLKD